MLRRYNPLRATRTLPRRRSKPRRSTRVRDDAYLDWLRTLPCCCPEKPEHPGGDPHHPRHEVGGAPVGIGRKADDARAIPLSRQHHRDIEERTGPFAGWSRQRVQAWHDQMATTLRLLYMMRKE